MELEAGELEGVPAARVRGGLVYLFSAVYCTVSSDTPAPTRVDGRAVPHRSVAPRPGGDVDAATLPESNADAERPVALAVMFSHPPMPWLALRIGAVDTYVSGVARVRRVG